MQIGKTKVRVRLRVRASLGSGSGLGRGRGRGGGFGPLTLAHALTPTKVFMRDDVLKHLEAPKNEVHGGASLVIQTAQRRHAPRTPALTRTLSQP